MNTGSVLGVQLETLAHEGLYRRREIIEGPCSPQIEFDGRRYTAFCSNDYLGLANHPEVVRAFKLATDRYGCGAGAAHLITGHTREHHLLEEELAAFTKRPRALLFSTGYMANLGVLSALATRHDIVFEDRLNHASLLDAARLSGAQLRRYPHADMHVLSNWFAKLAGDSRRFILTDGVFSMDGDFAPLKELVQLAQREGATLVVDDAHGLGAIGATGRGSLEVSSLGSEEVPVLIGTLGKAFGTFGAFVAGSDELIETLIQKARTYIYTTAPPAALAAATRAALHLVRSEAWRREHLNALVARFRAGAHELGLPLLRSTTPIQPLLLGESERAVCAAQILREQGLLVVAIRPPTVPHGSARLRITFSASHSEADIDRLLGALAEVQPMLESR